MRGIRMRRWAASAAGPAGAAERAVVRHHGSGDQTPTWSGATAHGSVYSFSSPGGRGAAIVSGVLGLLSHAAGLEASATGRTPLPRPALAGATAALCPAGHDLVCRRFAAGAVRDRPGLLRGLAPTAPAPG